MFPVSSGQDADVGFERPSNSDIKLLQKILLIKSNDSNNHDVSSLKRSLVNSILINILTQLTKFKWPAWTLQSVHQGAPPHHNTQPGQVWVGEQL